MYILFFLFRFEKEKNVKYTQKIKRRSLRF